MLDQVNGTPLNVYAVNTAGVDAQFAKHLSAEKNADVQNSLETQNIFGLHLTKAGRDRSTAKKLNLDANKYARKRSGDVKTIGMIIDYVKGDPSLHKAIAQHMGTKRWGEQFNFELQKNAKAQPLIDVFLRTANDPDQDASVEVWQTYANRRADEAFHIHGVLNFNGKDIEHPETAAKRTKQQELIISFIPKLPQDQQSAIWNEINTNPIYGHFGGGDGGSGDGGGGDGG